MVAVALALPPGLDEAVARDLERHGHTVVARCDDVAELTDAIGSRIAIATAGPVSRIDAAIVTADRRMLTVDLLAACDAAGVRVVAIVATDAHRRHAASVGLLETVDADAPFSVVERMLTGLPSVPPRESRPARGRVVAVWGPAGSPGRTALAISIAAELAAAGSTVALADVDTHSASIAPSLGLLDESPGFAAACRLAGAGSLTVPELERIGQRYLTGHGSFWVLTGLGRPSRWPELSGDRVTATLEACRDWVDVTVVDTASSLEDDEEISSDLFAPRRNAATVSALRSADRIVAVGAADPVGLSRFLRSHADLLEVVDTAHIDVVVNRVRMSAVGLNPAAHVEQTLRRFGGIVPTALVPDDRHAFDTAVLEGRTVRDTAPKSSARVAIQRFVEATLVPEGRTTTRRARRAQRARR
ncbi:CpaE family protein [Marisediminicola sp. LYQ85]|uniref:AAA family ATPase n=1 Tax=Marisediminicola sp. LYQ85 TaxID=3391062 RepID=UPI0039835D7C